MVVKEIGPMVIKPRLGIKVNKDIEVKVPAGVDTGHQLRLAEKEKLESMEDLQEMYI